jgi:hypothetical protein
MSIILTKNSKLHTGRLERARRAPALLESMTPGDGR